jgi:two-component system, cell cycle response regulator
MIDSMTESTSAFPPGNEARLLLVDDDPMMIRIIAEMLAEFPDQRFATSGEGALMLAREQTPDLILLDANLPDLTGFDVCEILKSDPRLARVPVIFVTSHDAPALEVDALRMGAADYVTKPLVASQLQARVRAQLRAGQRIRQAERAATLPELPPEMPASSDDDDMAERILAVVDDEATIDTLGEALASLAPLEFAAHCDAALAIARERPPSLVLLDAAGAADTARIGTLLAALTPFGQPAPVVLLTPAFDAEVEQRALDLGASDVMARPLKPAVLKARVRSLLASQRRTEAEIRRIIEARRAGNVRAFPGRQAD